MKQLTIKEICAYYPYGLQVQHTTFGNLQDDKIQIANVESINNECISFDNGCDYYFIDPEPDCEIKLLLRPLSELTKPITHNGEEILASDELSEYQLRMLEECDILDFLPYNTIQTLLSYHFDLFGLIKHNLAIDITILK